MHTIWIPLMVWWIQFNSTLANTKTITTYWIRMFCLCLKTWWQTCLQMVLGMIEHVVTTGVWNNKFEHRPKYQQPCTSEHPEWTLSQHTPNMHIIKSYAIMWRQRRVTRRQCHLTPHCSFWRCSMFSNLAVAAGATTSSSNLTPS